VLADQSGDKSVLDCTVDSNLLFPAHTLFDHDNGVIYQITDDLIDISPVETYFRKFSGLYFDKWSVCQFSQSSCNFSFSAACRSNHEDIFRDNLFAERGWDAVTAPAVAECVCDGLFSTRLTHNVSIEKFNDLARGKV
jgi:hypothetical protein